MPDDARQSGSKVTDPDSASGTTAPLDFIRTRIAEDVANNKNGGRVAKILKANGVPVKYHIFGDIDHYGIYRKRFVDATKMEIKWFDKYLKETKEK